MELIHGGDWAGQKERLGNRSIRDFSANVSPLGVPDGVREAICRAAGKIDRYPDPLWQKTDSKTLGGAFLSGRMDCLWQRGSGSDLSAVSGGKTEKSAVDSSGICGV